MSLHGATSDWNRAGCEGSRKKGRGGTHRPFLAGALALGAAALARLGCGALFGRLTAGRVPAPPGRPLVLGGVASIAPRTLNPAPGVAWSELSGRRGVVVEGRLDGVTAGVVLRAGLVAGLAAVEVEVVAVVVSDGFAGVVAGAVDDEGSGSSLNSLPATSHVNTKDTCHTHSHHAAK